MYLHGVDLFKTHLRLQTHYLDDKGLREMKGYWKSLMIFIRLK